MNRIFGTGKPKAPPPNLTDCIANVSETICGKLYIILTLIFQRARNIVLIYSEDHIDLSFYDSYIPPLRNLAVNKRPCWLLTALMFD